ncbi:MAG TPA: hypothetical protein VL651_00200 [Bacteroidia bacterium]|jgi:hypothetical protein|nr:hypothetical protein [Bacteroidia bacterium]
MRKLFLIGTTLLFSAPAFAQDQNASSGTTDDNTVQMTSLAGLLRAQLTLTPTVGMSGTVNDNTIYSVTNDHRNIYLHGTVEYYFDQHFSVRTDGFYYLNKDKRPGGLISNHSAEIGVGFHLLKSLNYDPFVGISSGWSFIQTEPYLLTSGTDSVGRMVNPNMMVTPVWGPRVGFNFFGPHVFHFFIEAQYLMATYRPDGSPSRNLNELRISAGLGWNWVFLHKEGVIRQNI